MRSLLRIPLVLAAAVCLSSAAVAQDNFTLDNADKSPTVGVGVICDTAEQVERLVSLQTVGTPPERAILVVNQEASNPRACGVAATAFVPGKALANYSVSGGTIRVLEITVFATATEAGWQKVPAQTQYTAVFVKSEEI